MLAVILLTVVCLAYANGANDNFKGVATLFGSGMADYRRALCWGTACTFAGSLTAVLMADTLLRSFSGRGLVSAAPTQDVGYLAAVGLGAALTVLLATRAGMPISTTHALVGGLVGAGWAAGSAVNLQALASQFFLPLLLSPVVSLVLTAVCYPLAHAVRVRLNVNEQSCFCVGSQAVEVVPLMDQSAALARRRELSAMLGTEVTCRLGYDGRVMGVSAGKALDGLHFVSAEAVSFARGLNDAPKIAALLVVGELGGARGLILVGLAMAAGGILSARRVAQTMSHKITPMNHGQGFTSNLVTSLVVIASSRLGLPVSTTHVSCGALFGLGAVTGGARWSMIVRVLLAWVTTLPCGAALGAVTYRLVVLL